MSAGTVAFLGGLLIGACGGVLIVSLLVLAGRADDRLDKMFGEDEVHL